MGYRRGFTAVGVQIHGEGVDGLVIAAFGAEQQPLGIQVVHTVT